MNAARAATTRAFLTSPGGTAYGAAVLTVHGQRFQGGQYSSFNHVTNVHAEEVVLVLATMADDPDVLALALASTSDDPVTRPCGVCRQVLAEHAARTGRDFQVLMAHRHGPGYERARVSELLPWSWTPQSRLAVEAGGPTGYRTAALRSGHPPAISPLRVGDHVLLTDGSIALVWDGAFAAEAYLTKIKYAAPTEQGRRKVAHSFTEPIAYQSELRELGWNRATGFGGVSAVVGPGHLQAVLPALPLDHVGDAVPGPVLNLLANGGVDPAAVRVSGSRAIGLQQDSSDWDLVVPVAEGQLPRLRGVLFDAVDRQELAIPPSSGTWGLLDRLFPGGQRAILGQRRFIDTVHSGGTSVALIFVPPVVSGPLLEPSWQPAGRVAMHGTVTACARAAYKRAEFGVETAETGPVGVTSYHKTANLLAVGDVISLRGWLLRRGEERRLVQLLSVPDNIVWLETVRR